MSGILLLLLQAAASTAAPDSTTPDARLLHPVPPAHCDRSATTIVVCGKDPDTYRLKQTGPQFDTSDSLPNAEWRLFGNVKAGVGTSQRSVGGFPSNAIMAKIKIPF